MADDISFNDIRAALLFYWEEEAREETRLAFNRLVNVINKAKAEEIDTTMEPWPPRHRIRFDFEEES